MGGTSQNFDLPFDGDAVLYIYDSSLLTNKDYLPFIKR